MKLEGNRDRRQGGHFFTEMKTEKKSMSVIGAKRKPKGH